MTLTAVLDRVPGPQGLRLDVERLRHIDHVCAEMLSEWIQRRREAGHIVELKGASGRLSGLLPA